MLEWMFTVSWEKYSELVEALVLDAGLTPSERSSMLGEDMPGGATQDASQMTLESIESNNGAKQYQTRTHSRGEVIAHKHYEQNHKKKIDESTSRRTKNRGETITGRAAGTVAVLMMAMVYLTSRMAIKGSLHLRELQSAQEMSDRNNSTSCLGMHTPMWGEHETGHEWQCTFPDRATKLGRKK